MKELDDKLLAKSSLDIALLPETHQDRQMAALMKLQSKSAQEREEEKRIDILLQPALPGATQTTFGGLKRQKALSSQLDYKQLGIRRKQNENENEDSLSKNEKEIEAFNEPYDEATQDISGIQQIETNQQTTSSNNTSACLVNLPKSLALVCDYASSNSSTSSSPSSRSDNEDH